MSVGASADQPKRMPWNSTASSTTSSTAPSRASGHAIRHMSSEASTVTRASAGHHDHFATIATAATMKASDVSSHAIPATRMPASPTS